MTLAQLTDHSIDEQFVESLDTLLRSSEAALPGKIVVVDDEPINIKVVQKYLRSAGYQEFVTTSDSRDAVDLIRSERPDVVLLDVMMPHVTGLNILEVIRGDRKLSHLPVLIVTAAADDVTKATALELGATDFLTKPIKPTELIPRVRNALVVKSHHDQMAAYSRKLEREVRARTEDLVRSRAEVIHVLACAAEYRDHDTGNHVLRVGRYVGILARQLGFSEANVQLIEQAAILHDVGKIGIPDAILLKPGRLEPAEFEQMQRHCEYGQNILRAVPSDRSQNSLRREVAQHLDRSPILSLAATITMSHHEKWDGSGYPMGIAGEEIPIEGRITAVADVFDALGSRRPYKDPMSIDRCCDILEEGRGKHFDPGVLDAFFVRLEEITRVAIELADD